MHKIIALKKLLTEVSNTKRTMPTAFTSQRSICKLTDWLKYDRKKAETNLKVLSIQTHRGFRNTCF